MPAPKFNFIPEYQLRPQESTVFKITITRNGNLYFPKEVINVYDLEGSFIKLFVDIEKRAIGFQVIKQADSLEGMKGLRKLSINRQNGGGTIQVISLLRSLGIQDTTTQVSEKYYKYDFGDSKKYELKKYESSYLLSEIYYIDLNEQRPISH